MLFKTDCSVLQDSLLKVHGDDDDGWAIHQSESDSHDDTDADHNVPHGSCEVRAEAAEIVTLTFDSDSIDILPNESNASSSDSGDTTSVLVADSRGKRSRSKGKSSKERDDESSYRVVCVEFLEIGKNWELN